MRLFATKPSGGCEKSSGVSKGSSFSRSTWLSGPKDSFAKPHMMNSRVKFMLYSSRENSCKTRSYLSRSQDDLDRISRAGPTGSRICMGRMKPSRRGRRGGWFLFSRRIAGGYHPCSLRRAVFTRHVPCMQWKSYPRTASSKAVT